VKRADLIRELEEAGCKLVRHGGKHDWYENPVSRMAQHYHRSLDRNYWG
jgi:hypothetical protein